MNKATEPLEKEGLLRQLRRLQAVDSCSRLYLGWLNRESAAQGVAAFDASWQQLLAFIAEEPEVELTCPFLWRVRLEIGAASPSIATFATEDPCR